MKRRNFSESFKSDAVNLVKVQGVTIAKAAKDLGISESALRRWVNASDVEQGTKEGLTVAEKAEVRDLKREVATLKMEREILKKATAFFAKENQ